MWSWRWWPRTAVRRACITTGREPRSGRASLEERFGLRRLEARARGTGSRGVRAGERMADARRHRDHGADGHAPERGSRQTLERIVRACATASRNETEFVRALREQNVRVRPRYAEGGRTAVVGYSVRAARTRQRAAALGLVWRRAPGARSDAAVAAGGVAAVRWRAGGRCEAVEHVDELAAAHAR